MEDGGGSDRLPDNNNERTATSSSPRRPSKPLSIDGVYATKNDSADDTLDDNTTADSPLTLSDEANSDHSTNNEQPQTSRTIIWSFWILGLLNNTPYVVMLAAAKNIAEGGVGLVYLANAAPALLVKISLPYWMERMSYPQRLYLSAISMAWAFGLVGIFSPPDEMAERNGGNDDDKDSANTSHLLLAGQLVGVALISFQSALGESSLLALAGKLEDYNSNHNNNNNNNSQQQQRGYLLTSFSSGTGLAGPFGFLWKILLTEWLLWSLRWTCFLAAVAMPLAYYGTFVASLQSLVIGQGQQQQQQDYNYQTIQEQQQQQQQQQQNDNDDDERVEPEESFHDEEEALPTQSTRITTRPLEIGNSAPVVIGDLSAKERFRMILSLWPYIIPLFTVYTAEYACQGGVWTAIGFNNHDDPADDGVSVEERTQFYETSNWLYQAGVFISRSSGNMFTLNMTWLWILPGLQVVNLVWMYRIAARQSFFTPWLYKPFPLYTMSLVTGFLGGSVYVHGYQRIIRDIAQPYIEFSITTVTMAEDLGIFVADVMSLFLQACLYEANGFSGAYVKCPFS